MPEERDMYGRRPEKTAGVNDSEAAVRRAHFLRLKEDALGEGRVFTQGRNPLWETRYGDRDYTVNGRYVVEQDKRLPTLDTPFARAYAARDVRPEGGEKGQKYGLYALVFEPKTYLRLETLNRLTGLEAAGCCAPLQWQIIPFPAEARRAAVIVLPRPAPMTLAEFIAREGPMHEKAAENLFLIPLIETLSSLAAAGVIHGSVNPGAVTIDPETMRPVLGQCVGAPCGFVQPIAYEPLTRMACDPFGKGECGPSPDLYALAVCAAYACYGGELFGEFDAETLRDLKYQKGVYRLIADKWRAGRRISDFLRGCLNEHPAAAWTAEHATDWAKGRKFNLLPPKPPGALHRPVHFMNKKYYYAPHLADAMGRRPAAAKCFLADSESMRWLERSMEENADSAEKLISFHARFMPEEDADEEGGSVRGRNDETLTQLLMVLDPDGPVRAPGLTARFTSLGTVFAEAERIEGVGIAAASAEWMLTSPVYMFWIENQSSVKTENDEEALFALRRAAGAARSRGAFSRERILYDLCRGAPCVDPICATFPVLSAEEALLAAERGELKIHPGVTWGTHLQAFMISRADLKGPPVLRKLRAFPEFTSRDDIRHLALAAAVQRALKMRKLPELCAAAVVHAERLTEEVFRGKTIRENVLRLAKAAAATGNLYLVLEALCMMKYHAAERAGGRMAAEEYRRNALFILSLQDTFAIIRAGRRYGLELSVAASYVLVALAATALTLNLF